MDPSTMKAMFSSMLPDIPHDANIEALERSNGAPYFKCTLSDGTVKEFDLSQCNENLKKSAEIDTKSPVRDMFSMRVTKGMKRFLEMHQRGQYIVPEEYEDWRSMCIRKEPHTKPPPPLEELMSDYGIKRAEDIENEGEEGAVFRMCAMAEKLSDLEDIRAAEAGETKTTEDDEDGC